MSRIRRDARRPLSWAETLAVAAIGATLILLISISVSSVRNDLKRQQVWGMLRQLSAALDAYHTETGKWPSPAADSSTSSDSEENDDAGPIITSLAQSPASLQILQRISPVLRVHAVDGAGIGTFQDAWGTRLHCFTARSPGLIDRQAVAANGGKPIFVSASEDGQFLGPDGSSAADNLRSDELPR